MKGLTEWKESYIEDKIKEKFMQMVTQTMDNISNSTKTN